MPEVSVLWMTRVKLLFKCMMNVGPMEVTLYKGTTIANFVPRRHVFLLEVRCYKGHEQPGVRSEKSSSFKLDLHAWKQIICHDRGDELTFNFATVSPTLS